MTGCSIRFAKLFDGGRKPVVVAIVHGMFDGPHHAMENIPATLEKLGDAPDGVLLSPGVLRECAGYFGRRGAPVSIVRINFNSVFVFKWGYKESVCTRAWSPEDAAALGAEVVLVCLTLKTGSEERDARNAELFCELCRAAHRVGLPVIGEYFPHSHLTKKPDEFHEEILIGCRMLEELGADCIKTFYTKDFKEVTSKVNIPILGLGAEKTPTDRDALELAWREARDGAGGVVFGRNAVQASNPPNFVRALSDILNRGAAVDDVVKKYGLK
jgi:DhnA family fructose-bisphosphate aldolase class Ia